MAPTGPGERAVHLSWFWPDAASLHTLSESPVSIPWPLVRSDPGLLFFLLTRDLPIAAGTASRVGEADLRAAARMLSDPAVPWADWSAPEFLPVTRTAVAAASFAELLAAATNSVEPGRAWAGAWLAYAGWLAVATVDPQAVGRWQTATAESGDPLGAQAGCWGRSRAEVAWGLGGEWPMPRWARVVLARLDAPPHEVQEFGGDRQLQALVQTAVLLAEQVETRLFVADEFDLESALGELGLRSPDLDRVRETYTATVDLDEWLDRPWTDPRQVPGLADRLNRAADRLGGRDSDDATTAVRLDVYTERVQAAKLAALAEFAAGASHEINNPLAVISGHSQYLLKQETDPRRREALESIVRQTRRIHAALAELMYFARPPVPRPEVLDLAGLARSAAADIAPLAAERQVEIECEVAGPIWIKADAKQLGMTLSALIRNGVEAAQPGGWVRVSRAFAADRMEFVVEDSGPGPDERSQEHLFDPFYSGRSAGRGRGLGLSAAWRLAREHGGEVRYVPMVDGPTRFVLSLPAALVAAAAQRKSA